MMALVEEKIRSALSPSILRLVDKSGGCGASFEAVIVSTMFEGKSLIDRHRLVNAAIAEEMSRIHAFSMKCHTPKEWEEKNKSQ
ncbi:BolA-like protein [Theileria orientalis]|uniref:BolA-like protein n=1 Tax=Theileria orientalis TaxID=68886 RepID=A0A976SL76_THEOR|nr:BolA-like protein [Theileria orientalis]